MSAVKTTAGNILIKTWELSEVIEAIKMKAYIKDGSFGLLITLFINQRMLLCTQ